MLNFLLGLLGMTKKTLFPIQVDKSLRYFNPKDGILIFAQQKSECRKKVWEKGVEFEEGKKDLSSKGLFPLLKEQPLLGTEP